MRGIYQIILSIVSSIGTIILLTLFINQPIDWWKLFALVALFSFWIKDFN